MPDTYTTVQGDTWDIIAMRKLGSEKLMHMLIEMNQQHRETVFFSAGTVLQLPVVTVSPAQPRPPWED